jgi:hypothetical protein
MTVVPLPDVPCVRVRPFGNVGSGFEWGNRFYISYSGSAPTAANLNTMATDVKDAWVTNFSPLQFVGYSLDEVDILDIATDAGASGNWVGTAGGSRSGDALPIQVAANVEYDIARRYRGGKPRAYFNFGIVGDDSAVNAWGSTFVGDVNTAVAAFFAAIEALDIGAMGSLQHVNLSYYKGFTNITNSSGRERAVPKYRDTALHDNVTGYATKAKLGSQRRRRSSTSP